jgi:hypothetical protein
LWASAQRWCRFRRAHQVVRPFVTLARAVQADSVEDLIDTALSHHQAEFRNSTVTAAVC